MPCGAGCCDTSEGEACCGGNRCVDTGKDPNNCGGCGKSCASGASCENGECTCPNDETECDGLCVDTDFDGFNCGQCGKLCSPDRACLYGTCVCNDLNQVDCDGTCADTRTDPHNCGTCGHACATGQACVAGVCKTECGQCAELVNGECVPLPLPPGAVCCEDPLWGPYACTDGNVCSAGHTCCPAYADGFTLCPDSQQRYPVCCSYGRICAPVLGGSMQCCWEGAHDPSQCVGGGGGFPDYCCFSP